MKTLGAPSASTAMPRSIAESGDFFNGEGVGPVTSYKQGPKLHLRGVKTTRETHLYGHL